MSWLARSIANSLKLDDDEDENNNNVTTTNTNPNPQNSPPSQSPKGVKEDLTELTQTLTRQFWGVASFLAPPPPHSDQSPPSDPELIEGIKTDFAEFGGKVRTGISKISQNIQVSEFTKLASNFLQFGDDGRGSSSDYEVGVTEEVVAFAQDIAMRPETWIEFPVPSDDGWLDDFELSDAQQEHALAVERLAPRLAALRIELCPGYMSESFFWMIYFVLLLPRLSKQDAQILITPEVIDARAMVTNELQNQSETNSQTECSQICASYDKETVDSLPDQHLSVSSGAQTESSPQKSSRGEAAPFDGQIQSVEHISTLGEAPSTSQTEPVQLKSSASGAEPSRAENVATEKHPLQGTEIPIIDRSVTEEESTKQLTLSGSSPKVIDEKYEDDGDDGDDWLKEESSEIVGISGSSIPIVNDEDVSFSDLEEEDGDEPTSYRNVTYGSNSSAKDSRDWVQLSGSSTELVKDTNAVKIRCDGSTSEQVRAHNTEKEDSNDWLNVDEIDEM